jgi:hypothetical protein
MALNASFGFTGKDIRPADCTVDEDVGDFVHISGNPIDNKEQVRKANPESISGMPAVGVIIFKPSTVTCLVQWFGETPDIFTGLVAGQRYFVGVDARAVDLPPRDAAGRLAQIMGVATTPTRFYVQPNSQLTMLFA